MKTKILVIFSLIMLSNTNIAQNLVVNPSFELYSNCPGLPGQISYADNWYLSSGTPDYFNPCATSSDFSVPSNAFGYQIPHHGDSYAGFGTWSTAGFPNKEIIRGDLSTPLTQGQTYYLKFYIAANALYPGGTDYECYSNNICVQVDKNAYPIAYNQSTYIVNTIVSDTLNWTEVSYSFVADTNYHRIFIGNWAPDSTIQYNQVSSGNCEAYYLLDNICLSTTPEGCAESIGYSDIIKNNNYNIYPNPCAGLISIDAEPNHQQTIEVFNSVGMRVHHTQFTSKEIDLQHLAGGHYIFVIRDNDLIVSRQSFMMVNK